ncbi:glutamate--tRNA ligase [Candidatus Woesebacteria bacterium]|nr:glutamate--tRNA ligase [Candidatus Woesebacteria bacterium]
MQDKQLPIRTRMAPSPTGEMHVASMATLLKNYAFAKRHHGQFILRIEDTDKTREVPNGVEQIQAIIRKFGLDWDEGPGKDGPCGPYIQSQRINIYQEKAQELVAKGQAYYCFCSKQRLEEVRQQQQANHQLPRYDQHCRYLSEEEVQKKLAAGESYVIRLKVPANQDIVFTDLLRGEISFNSNLVDDQVLLKSDGYPTYHLAVVVDDHLMKISHVMRGEEWISSTPKHVLLYQAFGWDLPIFAHFPLFLNPDGKGKMSKRKGTVSAQSFLDRGYLPEALLNFLMILGWARKDQKEIMSLEEYIEAFDPRDLSVNSVVFDVKKLDWLNGIYIRKLDRPELKKRLQPFIPPAFPHQKIDSILDLVYERLVTLADFAELTDFFYKEIDYSTTTLLKKAQDQPGLVDEQIQETKRVIASLDVVDANSLEKCIRRLQEKHDWHKGQYFMMLRIAMTGRTATPPLFETMAVLGKDLILERLDLALKRLSENNK